MSVDELIAHVNDPRVSTDVLHRLLSVELERLAEENKRLTEALAEARSRLSDKAFAIAVGRVLGANFIRSEVSAALRERGND